MSGADTEIVLKLLTERHLLQIRDAARLLPLPRRAIVGALESLIAQGLASKRRRVIGRGSPWGYVRVYPSPQMARTVAALAARSRRRASASSAQ